VAPEPVWMLWRQKYLDLPGIETRPYNDFTTASGFANFEFPISAVFNLRPVFPTASCGSACLHLLVSVPNRTPPAPTGPYLLLARL
jgi:hypothetical protein